MADDDIPFNRKLDLGDRHVHRRVTFHTPGDTPVSLLFGLADKLAA